MKKIAILVVLFAFAATPVFAAAITDSVKPLGHMKAAITVEDNYTTNREIKKPNSRTKFEMEKVNQIYAKGSLGIMDFMNVYVKLGASDSGKIKDNFSTGPTNNITTDYGFLVGAGITAAKEFGNGWNFGLDFQSGYWKTDVEKVTYDGTSTSNVSGSIKNWEFQTTPFISKKLEISSLNWVATPYVGMPIEFFRTETDGQIKFNDASSVARNTSWVVGNKNNIGIVVGSDLEVTKNFALQLEGRFVTETAVAGGATLRF